VELAKLNSFTIFGGTIIDPENNYSGPGGIVVQKGKITDVIRDRSSKSGDIDASGLLVCPGLVDMHVHLREPGFEYKETIFTGSQAAAAGGFTSIACMPNTEPALDNQEAIKFVFEKAKAAAVKVYPIGALTKGRLGKELAEMGDMADAGAVAFSDDGSGVQNTLIMRRAVEYCKMLDVPVISHCEFDDITDNGVMNEGYFSTTLGLRGTPAIAEELMIAREIMLAEYLDAHIHIAHVSTAGGVELIKNAKKRKIKITAESCPHYFTLSDSQLVSYDTNFKVNPPLRTLKDVKAIKKALAAGVFDAIVSDHAPHSYEEKALEFDFAPPGIIGLETVVGLVSTLLVHKNVISWLEAIRLLTIGPARVLNLQAGTFKPGSPADITVINPELEWTVTESDFRSLSRNSPYIGMKLTGRTVRTIVDGKTVFDLKDKSS
jgi:dihydroorotase